jgi:hypothetical protein
MRKLKILKSEKYGIKVRAEIVKRDKKKAVKIKHGNHFHRSKQERDVCIGLSTIIEQFRLGWQGRYPVKHFRLVPNFKLGGKEIDFLISGRNGPVLAVEHHPFWFNSQSRAAYRNSRERTLREHGIEVSVVVVKNPKKLGRVRRILREAT